MSLSRWMLCFVSGSLLGSAAVHAQEEAAAAAEVSLPPVEVVDRAEATAYRAGSGSTATRIDAPLRDVPQSINVVPQQVIRDQGASSQADVLRNVPGVGLSNGDGQRDQVTLRGFSAIGDQFLDGIRDDALYFRDLSNIERIEVLKGPASVLYGRGSSGGLINSVSKKPGLQPQQSLSLSAGSWNQRRAELDLGYADGEQRSSAYRLTGAVEDSGGYRDDAFLERRAVAPSAWFRLAPQLQLNLGATYLHDKRLIDFGDPALNGRRVDVRPEKRFGSADADQDYTRSEVSTLGGSLEYTIAPALTLTNTVRFYDYDLDRNNTLAHTDAKRFVDCGNGELCVKLKRGNVDRKEEGWFDQLELQQLLQIAGMDHQLLYGLELGGQDKFQRVRSQDDVARVPVFSDGLVAVPFEANKLGSLGTNEQNTGGLYLQDLVALSAQWKALLGLRYDVFEQRYRDQLSGKDLERTDYRWSPRAGLVYQPDAIQSYYLSVSRSFQPSGEMFALSASNEHLGPEKTSNYEVGGKWELFDGRLSTTAALFRLERSNIKTTDPANPAQLILAGEQRTDGVEVTATGQVGSDWQVYAGYAWLDAEITESNSLTNGVANEGQTPTLTPRHSANLWTVYRLGPAWRVGAGANYVGERYTALDNATTMPSYVTADLGLFYALKHWDLALNVRNLLDREYDASAHGSVDLITPGAPRNLTLRAQYRF